LGTTLATQIAVGLQPPGAPQSGLSGNGRRLIHLATVGRRRHRADYHAVRQFDDWRRKHITYSGGIHDNQPPDNTFAKAWRTHAILHAGAEIDRKVGFWGFT